jgi:hypothetical protein
MPTYRISGVVRIGGARLSIEEQMKPYLKKARKKRKKKAGLDMRQLSQTKLDPNRYADQERLHLSGQSARTNRENNQRQFAQISSRNIINNKTRALVQDAINLHPQIGYLHPDVQAGVGSQLIKAGYGGVGASLNQAVRTQDAIPSQDIYSILGQYDEHLKKLLSKRDGEYKQVAGAFYQKQEEDREKLTRDISRLEQKNLNGGRLTAEESSLLNYSKEKIRQLNSELQSQIVATKTSEKKAVRHAEKLEHTRDILRSTGKDKLSKTAQYIFGIKKETADQLIPLEGDHRTIRHKLNRWGQTGKNHVRTEDIADFLNETNIHELGDYHHLLPRLTSKQRRDYLNSIGHDDLASDESELYNREFKSGTLFRRGLGSRQSYEPIGFGDSTDDPDIGKEPRSQIIRKNKKPVVSSSSDNYESYSDDASSGSAS